MKQFTFTVNGIKYTYLTVEAMRNAIDTLNEKGVNVDPYSITIEELPTPKTVKQLVKLAKEQIKDTSMLEENLFVELVDGTILKVIESFASKLTLSKNDFYTLTDVYGAYNHCSNIEAVKLNLLIDTITEQLGGNNITYTQLKKAAIKKSL